MARTRDAIEARFRAGSNWFFVIGGLSALATTAFSKGWAAKPLMMVSLSLPMIFDQAAQLVPPRFFGTAIQHYSTLFGWVFAAVFVALGLLSKYGSHTGAFLNLGKIFGAFARLGGWLGFAHLVGSRLFYFTGLVLYTLDGVLGYALEAMLRSIKVVHLTSIVQWNLGFHVIGLMLLSVGFLSGLERERRRASDDAHT